MLAQVLQGMLATGWAAGGCEQDLSSGYQPDTKEWLPW